MQNNLLSSTVRRISALNVAILFLAATVLPVIGIVVAPKAGALPTSNVVLNEIFPTPTGGTEWVELYNNEATPIDLTGWTVADAASYSQTLSGVIPAGGYIVFDVDQFNNSGDTITLSDGEDYSDVVSYPTIASDESYARITDGDSIWETRVNEAVTKNASNNQIVPPVDTTAPAKPQMLGVYKGHNSHEGNFLECGSVTSKTEVRIDWADNAEDDLDYYWLGVAGNPKHTKVDADSFYDANITLENELYSYTVIAVDKSGNESAISYACTIKLDQVAPRVEITAPADGSVVSGTVTISGKIVDDNPNHYYLVVKDVTGEVVAGPSIVYAADVADYLWDTTNHVNGIYYILLSARDKAGNKDVVNFSVDNITVTVQNPGPGEEEEEEDNDGEENGSGNGHGAGTETDDEVTVTVVSSATNQDVRADTNQDQTLSTNGSNDQTADEETEVLAESDQNSQPGSGEESQEQAVAEDNSSTWWWVLGFLALLFLLYQMFRRNKNKGETE